MNPDERERLVRVEDYVEFHGGEIVTVNQEILEVKKQLINIDKKVDQLVAASKGAWWAATKISGVLIMVGGWVAWVWERVK